MRLISFGAFYCYSLLINKGLDRYQSMKKKWLRKQTRRMIRSSKSKISPMASTSRRKIRKINKRKARSRKGNSRKPRLKTLMGQMITLIARDN